MGYNVTKYMHSVCDIVINCNGCMRICLHKQHSDMTQIKSDICIAVWLLIIGRGYLAATGNVNFDLILPVMHCACSDQA